VLQAPPVPGAPVAITIYGIKSCETIKKARAWLDGHGVVYVFHDYRADGVPRERLERWCKEVGWDALLNRAGTTFRALPEKEKQNIDARKAIALMMDQPAMIKRPVLDLGRKRLVGFKPDQYAELLAK
jgi:arsenate reductase